MDETSILLVYQDVRVVPVLNLQDVANQRVGSKGVCQVVHGVLELRPELKLVEVYKIHVSPSCLDHFFLDVVNAESVWDEFNNAAVRAS